MAGLSRSRQPAEGYRAEAQRRNPEDHQPARDQEGARRARYGSLLRAIRGIREISERPARGLGKADRRCGDREAVKLPRRPGERRDPYPPWLVVAQDDCPRSSRKSRVQGLWV